MAIKKNNTDRPLPKQQPGDITTMPIDPDTPDDHSMKSIPVNRPTDLPDAPIAY